MRLGGLMLILAAALCSGCMQTPAGTTTPSSPPAMSGSGGGEGSNGGY